MHTVSDEWKSIQRQMLVNESFVEISFGIEDPDATADASASDNGSVYISDTSSIISGIDNNPVLYATLEQNMWPLDGSVEFIPQTEYGDNGYIGNVLSDQYGWFNPVPYVKILYTSLHEPIIPGITITWGEAYSEYPNSFRVTAFNGTAAVATKTIINNSSTISIVEIDVENYDQIRIDILKWCLPHHRPRVSNVFLGIEKRYFKSDLVKFEHLSEVDPIGATLPKHSVSFSIDNSNNQYDPNNVTGLSKYLMERQQISVKYGLKRYSGGIEYIPAGIFYLSEWSALQNGIEAGFVARDLFEFMQKTYIKGSYSPSGVSLYDLAINVLEEANLPLNQDGSVKWAIDESLEDIFTTAPLPLASLAVCLQYIAQAARCVLYCDRTGTIRIEPISSLTTDYALTTSNMFLRPEISLQKPISSIATKVYNYFVDVAETELFNKTINVDGTIDVIITYSEPSVNVSAELSSGTLDHAEYYTNACVLTITGSGNIGVVITGNTLKTPESEHVNILSTSNGEIQVVENPLISSEAMASNVGIWVGEWLNNRNIIQYGGWRADPRLDPTDIITSSNKFGTDAVRMTSVKYQYTGSFRGSGEGRVI
jgi:hypothetical protein